MSRCRSTCVNTTWSDLGEDIDSGGEEIGEKMSSQAWKRLEKGRDGEDRTGVRRDKMGKGKRARKRDRGRVSGRGRG